MADKITTKDFGLREKTTKTRQLLDDYDARLKLSKMIGLDEVPKNNPHALYELAGISAKKIKLKTIDVVELVSEARSSDA